MDLGYLVCQTNVAVFYKTSGNNYPIVAIATDNLTRIGNSTKDTSLIKLGICFEIVDLGAINWLLSMLKLAC